MKAWEKLSSKEQKVGYRTVTLKDFKMPDGRIEEYTTWNKVGLIDVAIIALTQDYQVVIARQYRPGPERILDELPGGNADDGEDFAKAAMRELEEETGYICESADYLGMNYRDAYTNAVGHYYIARNCEPRGLQKLDVTEHIEIVLISIKELLGNAKTGKMSDSVAVLLAYNELEEILHAKKSN